MIGETIKDTFLICRFIQRNISESLEVSIPYSSCIVFRQLCQVQRDIVLQINLHFALLSENGYKNFQCVVTSYNAMLPCILIVKHKPTQDYLFFSF